jgi:hypothetical protein
MNELLDMVKRIGLRLDAMALDLARDAGLVARSAKAFADASRDQATIVACSRRRSPMRRAIRRRWSRARRRG